MAQKPNAPSKLKLARSGSAIKISWTLPSNANTNNDRRWDYQDIKIWFNSNLYRYKTRKVKNSKGKTVKEKYLPWTESWDAANKKNNKNKGRNVVGDRIWVRGLGTKAKAFKQAYKRASYYPKGKIKKKDRFLKSIHVETWSGNGAGSSKMLKGNYTFQLPPKPGIDDINYNQQSSVVSTKITMDEKAVKNTKKEWYDTQYRITRWDNIPGTGYATKKTVFGTTTKTVKKKGKTIKQTVNIDWKSTNKYSQSWSWDYNKLSNLQAGEWVEIEVTAYSRGIRGKQGSVSKKRIFCQPPIPTIKSIKLDNDTVHVLINTNQNVGKHQLVDKVELQVMRDTLIRTAEVAALAPGDMWDKVEGMEGDGSCSGFTEPAVHSTPSDTNRYTYYRVASTHDQYVRYSKPMKATDLKAAVNPVWNDEVRIYDVSPGSDSESLVVKFAWQDDDSTGTEISWSEFEDAWESNIDPSSKPVTWEDTSADGETPDPKVVTDQTNPNYNQDLINFVNSIVIDSETAKGKTPEQLWALRMDKMHTAKLSIRSLTESTKYYVKARRFSDIDGDMVYSKKVATAPGSQYPIAPYSLPTSVTVSAQPYSRKGDDYEVRWTTEGDSMQKAWDLYRVVHDVPVTRNNVTTYEDRLVVEKHGDDSSGATVISAERMEELVEGVEDNSIDFVIGVSTSEANTALQTKSDQFRVTVQEPPSIEVAVDRTLEKKPFRFFVRTDDPSARLVYKIESEGITVIDTTGDPEYQVEGDIVYSDMVEDPAWVSLPDGTSYTVITAQDEDTDYYDTCDYNLQIFAVSNTTEMQSEQIEKSFTVAWEHQAVAPGDGTTVSVDMDSKSVTIVPEKPAGWVEGDVVDIYRTSLGRTTQIGGNIQFGSAVTDRFAPYSKRADLYYRLVTRTVDGDFEFNDVYYEMPLSFIRFDWGDDDFLELPYNNDISIKYQKDFESKAYSDGQISGRWNPSVAETASLRADILRLSDYEQHRKLVALAEYPGAVFVRLPNGAAFTANVNVSNITDRYNTMVNAISLDVTRIRSQEAFELQPKDIVVQEGTESAPEETTSLVTKVLSWFNTPPAQDDVYVIADFVLNDQVTLTLKDSSDDYAASWTIQNTEVNRSIKLGELQQELVDHLASDSITEDTLFLLVAEYEVDMYAVIPTETVAEQSEENASPMENSWYEYSEDAGELVPTLDEEIDEDKEYYESIESAEYEDDEVYVPVTFFEEDDSPYENDWYELVNDEYILSEDDEVVPGKTYYAIAE